MFKSAWNKFSNIGNYYALNSEHNYNDLCIQSFIS